MLREGDQGVFWDILAEIVDEVVVGVELEVGLTEQLGEGGAFERGEQRVEGLEGHGRKLPRFLRSASRYARLLAERKLARVVVVLNFVNDPFELGRPNRTRHTVWDGWAVRSETAPTSVLEFPGRRRLFSESHAVYALRRWLHDRGAAAAPESADLESGLDLGTPSEGGLHDLVVASNSAHQEATRSEVQAGELLAQTRQRAEVVARELDGKLGDLDSLVSRASNFRFDHYNNRVARSSPGDIVNDNSSEEGRAVVVTAAMIREAARTREALLASVLKSEAKQVGEVRVAHTLLADQKTLAAERDGLRAQIASGVPPIPRPSSQFRGYLEDFKRLCDEHGAELVVVALPIDVQVDRGEWAKYGVTEAPDMSESLVLLDDLIADAQDLGLRALDATAALRAAQPGVPRPRARRRHGGHRSLAPPQVAPGVRRLAAVAGDRLGREHRPARRRGRPQRTTLASPPRAASTSTTSASAR